MIHRGLSGMKCFTLDILFCDPEPSLVKFVSDDCLSNQNILNQLQNADAFASTIELKAKR
jgi:hypothetical protein